ncbi:MAG: hypothetical protein M1840_004641 [Geoglossum simile]|nr:MAG: hypothetical protein M1840_004641 [Geoglossum simile]
MSFGYGIGDIVLLGQLAWKAYKSCKDAPESFKNISYEVLSLHALLKEIEENLSAQTLSPTRQARLKTIGDGCRNVLEELQSLVDKYESLGTQSKRTWDRMKWGSVEIAELRSRLISNALLLTAFISTTQVVVEKKLDTFLQEYQDGKHEGSTATTQTVESLSTDEKQSWRIIRKELEDIGITVAAFDANRDFIMNWFKAAIVAGAFEEQTLEDASSGEDDLGQSWEGPQHATAGQSVIESFDPLSIQNTLIRNPASLEAQSTQIPTTQKATSSPAVLPADELSTSANTQVTQNASQKVPTRRERTPRVAALIAWAFRYDKELINAASQGQEAVVRRLLEKGADVNAENKYGSTALNQAANEAVARFLLEKGANVNAENKEGWIALHVAANQGHKEVAQLLLEKGADVNAEGRDGWIALHTAANQGHEAVAQLLLEKGANVNAENKDGWIALHMAAIQGHEAVARLLLEKGANVNAESKGGWTALHWAAIQGHEAVARLLLEKGANVNGKDKDGRTALGWAVIQGHEAVVRLLLEKGANVNAKDKDGTTALDMAAIQGHEPVVQLLQTSALPPY